MKALFVTIASVLTLSVAGVAQAQPFAYVANQSANTLSVINTANETVVATVPVGTGPRGVAVNASGTRVYAANITSNDVSVIDTATNTVISAIPVGTGPRDLAINSAGTRLYVSNSSTNNLSVIDTMTNTVIATAASQRGKTRCNVAAKSDGGRTRHKKRWRGIHFGRNFFEQRCHLFRWRPYGRAKRAHGTQCRCSIFGI